MKKNFTTLLNGAVTGMLLTFSSSFAWSQSDLCTGAPVLAVGASCSPVAYTVPTSYADNLPFEPACGNDYIDGFYQFVATSTTTTVTITDDTGGGPNPGLLIVSGTCGGAWTSLGCSQNANGSDETVAATTVVGQTYYAVIFTINAGGGGAPTNPTAGTICATSGAAPSNITMTNGSTSTCNATFLDPGGTANYANSQNFTYTICPSTPGARLQALFTSFQTENTWDFLYIYDGNSTAAPLIGTYTGGTGPGTVAASVGNPTGCLTFRFTSDGSNVASGFSAIISCIIPCQTITSNWVSSNEAPMGDGVIRICQGQSINLVGSGTFGTSGTGATYAWTMGNGVTVSGANVNYTYPAVGSYLANLVITDPTGCTNSNSINRNIQVSTTPTITTSATPATLCTNQTSALAATVTMTPYNVNCTPPVSGVTFLPDGSGVSYSTSITTNCYSPTAMVTTGTDITNICLNMEHSYSGDLSMSIVCPNGQSASLITYPSGTGSANLGIPWATGTVDLNSGNTTPGVGSTYCFSMTGGTPWATSPVVGGTFPNGNGPGTYGDSYIPAGTYTPMQNLNSLIGCPLNGSWTIQVTDNLNSDNGNIFDWDINFSAALLSAASYTPTIVSQGWVAATTLSSTGTTTANVTPTNQGTPCFTYSVTDNFGCTYTAPQCITVNCGTSLPIDLISFEATAVNNTSVKLNWVTSSEQNNDYFTVERSLSGFDGWEQVTVVNGAGSSEAPEYYSAVDNLPLSGVSYYRLKQTDFDGVERIHEMESVYIDISGVSDLVIFPNPATDLVTLKGDIVSLSTFKFLNAMGQDIRLNVSSYKQGDGTLVLDISSLRSGVYLIKNGSKVYSLVKQ